MHLVLRRQLQERWLWRGKVARRNTLQHYRLIRNCCIRYIPLTIKQKWLIGSAYAFWTETDTSKTASVRYSVLMVFPIPAIVTFFKSAERKPRTVAMDVKLVAFCVAFQVWQKYCPASLHLVITLDWFWKEHRIGESVARTKSEWYTSPTLLTIKAVQASIEDLSMSHDSGSVPFQRTLSSCSKLTRLLYDRFWPFPGLPISIQGSNPTMIILHVRRWQKSISGHERWVQS